MYVCTYACNVHIYIDADMKVWPECLTGVKHSGKEPAVLMYNTEVT